MDDKYLDFDAIEPDKEYFEYRFGPSNQKIQLSGNHFINCQFEQTNFSNGEWLDCTFENMDFANADFRENIIYRCRFNNCRMMGTQIFSSKIKDTTFIRCDNSYFNITDSLLTNVNFDEVKLDESNFNGCQVKNKLLINRCQLTGTDFSDVKLNLVDLSNSTFDFCTFSPDLLAGLTIDYNQLLDVANSLGIEIK